ncbi:MAG: hypothetical protein ACRC5H_10590, partial [Treponemataceae bacterium]
MKKNYFIMLVFFYSSLLIATPFNGLFSTSTTYISTQKNIFQQGIRLKSNFFDTNAHFILGKENNIKNIGLIILPQGFISIGAGQLVTTGFLNRLKAQTLTRQSLFHSHATSVTDFSYKLASATTSTNTPYSFILNAELNRIKIFAGTAIAKNQKVFINDAGLQIPLYVGFSISLFDSYKV